MSALSSSIAAIQSPSPEVMKPEVMKLEVIKPEVIEEVCMKSAPPRVRRALAFAPACVGNVGGGSDILGHSMAGAGDRADVRHLEAQVVRISAIPG